jgi:hypothetical protein
VFFFFFFSKKCIIFFIYIIFGDTKISKNTKEFANIKYILKNVYVHFIENIHYSLFVDIKFTEIKNVFKNFIFNV